MTDPTIDQNVWAHVLDDGSESGSTISSQSTSDGGWTQDVDTVFRVRFEMDHTAGDAANGRTYQLQYFHTQGTAAWTNIGAGTPIQNAVSAETSWTITDTDVTTDRLSGDTGTFIAGQYSEDGLTGTINIAAGEHNEVEYCVTIDSAQVANNDTILLRVIMSGAQGTPTYGATPTITVNEAAPQNLGAGAQSLTVQAPTATLSPGAATLAAGALALALAVAPATLVAGGGAQNLAAGLQALAVQAPAAILTGAVSLSAGAQSLAIAAPSGTEVYHLPRTRLGLYGGPRPSRTIGDKTSSTALAAGSQSLAISAPASTLSAGAAVVPANDQALALSVGSATVVAGGGPQTLAAGASSLALAAPAETIAPSVALNAGTTSVAITAPDASLATSISVASGANAISLSAPTVGLQISGTTLTAGAQGLALTAPTAVARAQRILAAGAQTQTLQAGDISQIKPGLIDSGRVVVASDTTTSLTAEDIAGASTTVTLVRPGEIMAVMSIESSVDTGPNKEGNWLIDINGVDSPVITRNHSNASDTGSVGVCFRSETLSAGTYTIKGEHYTEATTTLTSANVTLVAIALQDDSGRTIGSVYDTVASDTTTSTTLEDIDGLTQDLTLDASAELWAVLTASISTSGNNTETGVALDLASESFSMQRITGTGGDVGAIGVVGRTGSRVTGSQTFKGQHRLASGTLTTAPSILVGIELAIEPDNLADTNYEIPSARTTVTTASTTSGTLVDITGLNHSIVLDRTCHIFSVMALDASKIGGGGGDCDFAIQINGVDQDAITRTFSNQNDDGVIFIVARTAAALTAGTYDVKGRWSTTSGTVSIVSESHLVTLALETTEGPNVVLNGANALALSAPIAELVQEGLSLAGIQTLAISAPDASPVVGAISLSAGAQNLAVSVPIAVRVQVTPRAAGANAVAISAPDATLGAGAATVTTSTQALALTPLAQVAAGAVTLTGDPQTLALSVSAANLTQAKVLPAGTGVVSLSAPLAGVTGGPVSVAAGAQVLTLSTSAASVDRGQDAGTQALTISAPDATLLLSVSAGSSTVAISAPSAVTVSGAVTLAAGQQALAISGPPATALVSVTLEAGSTVLALTVSAATIPTPSVTREAALQLIAISAPSAVLQGGVTIPDNVIVATLTAGPRRTMTSGLSSRQICDEGPRRSVSGDPT